MRFSLLLLLLFSSLVSAEWTGVALEIGETDSDWKFEDDIREAQVSEINFQIEEKIETGLTFGAISGYFDMRVIADSDSAAETLKFDGQYLGLYIRQPLPISKHVSFHGLFSIRYANGTESGADEEDDEKDIDWTQSSFELGLNLRFSRLRIAPYAIYQDVDGDISGGGTEVFEPDEPLTQGVRFDYFVEDTAFVRFEFVTGGRSGGYLSFVRRY